MSTPPRGADLWLRGRPVAAGRPVVMAVVNRTPDSFFAAARSEHADDAVRTAAVAVADGADMVDIGGVRAGRGREVSVAEEIDRVVPVISRLRTEFPDLPISVDTWRAEVAEAAAQAGADLLNDTWAGHDPDLVHVAGRRGLGVVCSHTGGLEPRSDPLRVQYPGGVVADVLDALRRAASRAIAAGVDARSIVVDPTLDFGKTTWHSIELVRATAQVVELGWPTMLAVSRKDVIGESLDLPVDDRLEGTLAATAVAVWLGAGVVRAHDVAATRRTIEMVAVLRGDLPPARALRGLV